MRLFQHILLVACTVLVLAPRAHARKRSAVFCEGDQNIRTVYGDYFPCYQQPVVGGGQCHLEKILYQTVFAEFTNSRWVANYLINCHAEETTGLCFRDSSGAWRRGYQKQCSKASESVITILSEYDRRRNLRGLAANNGNGNGNGNRDTTVDDVSLTADSLIVGADPVTQEITLGGVKWIVIDAPPAKK